MITSRKKNFDHAAFVKSALEFMAKRGPEGWSLPQLARSCGVPRSTIYYYYGSSRELLIAEIFASGARNLLGFAALLEMRSAGLTGSNFLLALMERTMDVARQHPWALAFYRDNRHKLTVWGESIREVEKRHVQNLQQVWQETEGHAGDPVLWKVFVQAQVSFLLALQSEKDMWEKKSHAQQRAELCRGFVALWAKQLQATAHSRGPSASP